jgi:predicted Zn-dependent protease
MTRMHLTRTPNPVFRWLNAAQLKWYLVSITVSAWSSRLLARTALLHTRLFSRWNRDAWALRWAGRAARLDDRWDEPWVAMGALQAASGKPALALEALIGANARHPHSRVVTLMLAGTLDDLGMCEEAYLWHRRAAHAAWENAGRIDDGHPDSLFWRELGIFCLEHRRYDEAREVAAFATLYEGWSGGVHAAALERPHCPHREPRRK